MKTLGKPNRFSQTSSKSVQNSSKKVKNKYFTDGFSTGLLQ